jgi:hypothetical protein
MREDYDAPQLQPHAVPSVYTAKPPQGVKFPWSPRPARRGDRLIVTPLLEFPATPRKQSPEPISNRYKTAISISAYKILEAPRTISSPLVFGFHESRIPNRHRRQLKINLTRPNSITSKILIGSQMANKEQASLTPLVPFPIIAGFISPKEPRV